MKKLVLFFACFILAIVGFSHTMKPRFKVLALSENSGHHILFSNNARLWLDKLAVDSNFQIDYIHNTDKIDDRFLERYNLFIQLDFAPYGWTDKAVSAFQKYITEGKGGWIGFHHASLLGEFDGFAIWPWFSNFMGGIRFSNYIPGFADGKVNIEDKIHPVMKNLPPSFVIRKEEWYTYNKSPRDNVHVLASVDEASYSPSSKVKMGDHPVVWTNDHYAARNVYIFMGHSPDLFNDQVFITLFRNAIFWAAVK